MKGTKGITLLALIITIVILVILAGITVGSLTGKEGALRRAESSVNKTNNEISQGESIINDIAKQIIEDSTINMGGDFAERGIIPIYNEETLQMIGTGERMVINGKEYKFMPDSQYVLLNNIEYTGNYDEIIQRIQQNNIRIIGNGNNKIAVTKDENTDYYVEKYNFCAPEGKVYASLYKISNSEYHLIFNATGWLAQGYTQDKLWGTSDDISQGTENYLDADGAVLLNKFENFDKSLIKKVKIEEEINPISTRGYFYGLSQITEIEKIQNINTSNVETMRSMFNGCSSLTSLDISSFNTSNVTDMNAMFYGCSSLTSLDISSFNTSNVTAMYAMFYECSSLTSLDISSFNTSNVTDMYAMYDHCSNLTTIYVGNNWTISALDLSKYNNYPLFYESPNLVGAISFDSSKTNTTYANWATGYLTYKAKNLNEYQNLQYIQSKGTQYIDTGFIANQDTRFTMKIKYNAGNFIFGSDGDTSGYLNAVGLNKGTSTFRWHYDSQRFIDNGNFTYGNVYNIDINKNIMYLEGTQVASFNYTNFTTPTSVIISGIRRGNSIDMATYGSSIEIYNFKIYNNGTLVRDFVPCKVKADNSIGLYDRITGIFYPNKGTGTFTAGPNV